MKTIIQNGKALLGGSLPLHQGWREDRIARGDFIFTCTTAERWRSHQGSRIAKGNSRVSYTRSLHLAAGSFEQGWKAACKRCDIDLEMSPDDDDESYSIAFTRPELVALDRTTRAALRKPCLPHLGESRSKSLRTHVRTLGRVIDFGTISCTGGKKAGVKLRG
jgi:hypothetical protein